MSISDKAESDSLTCELIASQLIIKKCTFSRARTYLTENCFVDRKNYALTIVLMVALITSFGANSGRTSGGEREKDTNKPDAIVSIHLADDTGDNLDDNESVESFESDNSNNGRTNSDEESVTDKPISTSEKEDDITVSVVTTDDDNNDDNSVDDDCNSKTSNDGSDGVASDSDDRSYTSEIKTLRTTKTLIGCLIWPWQTRILKTISILTSLTAVLTSGWTFNPTMTLMLKEYLTTMNLPIRLYVWPTPVILKIKMKTSMVNFKNVVDQIPPQAVMTLLLIVGIV